MSKVQNLPLAISFGEPAGIGSDLILRVFAKRKKHALPAFIVYGNLAFFEARAKRLGLDIKMVNCAPQDAVEHFANHLPIIDIKGEIADTPSEINKNSAPIVIEAIRRAVGDVKAGICSALVTAPINKAALYNAGFNHPGHTEFLASLCIEGGKTPTPVMMLAHKKYRTIPLTIHVPLSDVAKLITQEKIIETTTITAKDLARRFGISNPKIAIAGLNPHAGEDASIGLEDRDIIAPAVEQLQAQGIDAVGPLAADTLFHPPHWAQYDAVIAMYHDQALIPIKTLAFDKGVNITLGLPFIRTSPDHGTAFDLAGTKKASVKSMLAAIKMAQKMSNK